MIHYLLLLMAVALFCVSVVGRRSGYVIGGELLALAAFLVFWMIGMSLLPERAPLGTVVPVVLAIGCAVVAVVLEMGASTRSADAGPLPAAAERKEAHVEDSARLTVAGFFWAMLFALMAIVFAPYVLS